MEEEMYLKWCGKLIKNDIFQSWRLPCDQHSLFQVLQDKQIYMLQHLLVTAGNKTYLLRANPGGNKHLFSIKWVLQDMPTLMICTVSTFFGDSLELPAPQVPLLGIDTLAQLLCCQVNAHQTLLNLCPRLPLILTLSKTLISIPHWKHK